MKLHVALLAVLALSAVVMASGCTSSRDYQQPSQTSQGQDVLPSVTTFKVGETATDGKLKITLNNVTFMPNVTVYTTTNIGGLPYTSSYTTEPKAGNQFLVLDVTIENAQTDKTAATSALMSFKVTDADGYSYSYSIATAYLDKKWEDGDLLPGTKRRGSVAIEVPENPAGLKFAFLFGIGGQTAVFYLQ